MALLLTALSAGAALLWCGLLAAPWRPWTTAETLDAAADTGAADLSDVTVLIPARNERATLALTLAALKAQGSGLRAVVIDDQSSDGTAEVARTSGLENLTVLTGKALPAGWSGKLWALEQGRRQVTSRLILLLDADIRLQPGTVAALRHKLDSDTRRLVSLMAAPVTANLWERLLMPAFIYFFKLLYPFRLANSARSRIAAAAGGCVLLDSATLDASGGFGAIRGELIDDCALARLFKHQGHATWLGLSHCAQMLRRQGLREIWNMVARSAYCQLHYSIVLLAVASCLMVLAFMVPLAALCVGPMPARLLALTAVAAMLASYRPTLRYYGLPGTWACALPLAGALYLLMTWTAALRYAHGQRSRWKNRVYAAVPAPAPKRLR